LRLCSARAAAARPPARCFLQQQETHTYSHACLAFFFAHGGLTTTTGSPRLLLGPRCRCSFAATLGQNHPDTLSARGNLAATLQEQEYTLGEGAQGALLAGFTRLVARPGWANARHAGGILKDLPAAARERVHHEGGDVDGCITYDDAQAVMAKVLRQLPQAGGHREHAHVGGWMAAAAAAGAGDVYATDDGVRPPPPAQRQAATEAQRVRPPALGDGAAAGDAAAAGGAAPQDDAAAMLASREQRWSAAADAAAASAARRAQRQQEAADARAQEAALHRRLQELREAQAAQEALAAAAAQLQAAQEAARLAEEAAAALAREEAAQAKLREMGRCPASFRWRHLGGGQYQCEGGSHFASIQEMGL